MCSIQPEHNCGIVPQCNALNWASIYSVVHEVKSTLNFNKSQNYLTYYLNSLSCIFTTELDLNAKLINKNVYFLNDNRMSLTKLNAYHMTTI